MTTITTTNTVAIDEVADTFQDVLALREQIAVLKAELEVKETAVKDAIGSGDAASIDGRIVATYKEATRVSIPLSKARGLLAERTISRISTVTTYRTLKVVKP